MEELGSGLPYFYQGHPVLVHTAKGDRDGVIELPKNWDATNFKWPEATSDTPTRVDVGAKTPEEVAKLGISIGDTITIAILPLTYWRTNLHALAPGAPVNVEADVLVKLAHAQMQAQKKPEFDLTESWLVANGY